MTLLPKSSITAPTRREILRTTFVSALPLTGLGPMLLKVLFPQPNDKLDTPSRVLLLDSSTDPKFLILLEYRSEAMSAPVTLVSSAYRERSGLALLQTSEEIIVRGDVERLAKKYRPGMEIDEEDYKTVAEAFATAAAYARVRKSPLQSLLATHRVIHDESAV